MTIPAMAPEDRPDPELSPPDPESAVELGEPEAVLDGKTGGIDTVVGSSTPSQRASTFAVTQHESVEFTVLSLQKAQSPWRLSWYPHSSASLRTASMQRPLSASVGFEQRAKSDRI
jgi:hypothetical protein